MNTEEPEEVVQEIRPVLPRLLEVVEDTAPGSPGFGEEDDLGGEEHAEDEDEVRGDQEKQTDGEMPPRQRKRYNPGPNVLPEPDLVAPPGAIERLPHPPRHQNPTLDFFCLQFDAVAALNTDLERPNMNVAPLNSVSQCRFILPSEMSESLAHLQQLSTKTKEDIEKQRSRAGPARVRRMADEWKESAVEKIAQNVSKGPLLLLKQLYFRGSRVKVVTRHVRGVRGTCTGLLRAFDKHMNLILQDVVEQYTVRIRIERSKMVQQTEVVDNPAPAEGGPTQLLEVRTVEKTRTAHKLDTRSRKLKQIFVRGNNIVMVCAAAA